jgi:hypothetical protein
LSDKKILSHEKNLRDFVRVWFFLEVALVRFQFNQVNNDEVLLLDLRAVYLGLWVDDHQYLLISAT